MLSNFIKICKIYPYTDEDGNYLYDKYSNSAVDIIENKEIELGKMPTIIIGWENVKKNFPEQSILDKKINNNTYWVYSLTENKKEFKKDVDNLIKKFIQDYFSRPINSYDAIIDGSLKEFISKNINPKNRTFIYFHKNACYFHNDGNNCAISLSSLEFVGKDYKKTLTNLIEKVECTIFSYYNTSKYTYYDNLRTVMTTENNFWVKYNHYLEPREFSEIFLGEDVHRYIPLMMRIINEINPVTNDEINSCKRQAEKSKITSWLSENRVYFNKSFKLPKGVPSTWDNDKKYLKLRYSDKRTITGRINCIDSFNVQMLPKDSDTRRQIISRFKGGRIAVFDYKSFETRLAMYLSRDEDFIKTNMNLDLHLETSKVVFKRENLNEKERELGKSLNHTILYGGGDRLLKKIILENDIENVDESLERVKTFLNPILSTTTYVSDVYKELGYIINPFGTLVRPNKTYAAFNNYVQSTAADIVIDKLFEIKEWMKSKESRFMFQVHDSFVFDISPNDENPIEDLNNLLSKYNDMVFNVVVKHGENYMLED